MCYKYLLILILLFCTFVPSKTTGVSRNVSGFLVLNPITIVTVETDVSVRNIARPVVRGESLPFFITSKTTGVSMKHQPKVISLISPQTFLQQLVAVKKEIYSLSLQASAKKSKLDKELETFISDRSFLDLNLSKAMRLIVELADLKERVNQTIQLYGLIEQQLKLRRAA